MAIFHLNAKVISRANGRSATAASAYRAAQKIKDERTGLVFDYTRKREVVYRQILAPRHAPEWAHDRAQLWNHAEKSEARKDAQIAREIEVALPLELSQHQQINLLERFIKTQFVSQGMVADVCIHNKPGNPHAHILLTTRDISLAGFGPKNRDWNSKQQLEEWRQQWASHCNRKLLIAGSKSRIDSRSLQAQGIDRVSTVHIGPTGTAMAAKGLPDIAAQLNQYIKEQNMIIKNTIGNQPSTKTLVNKTARKFVSMPVSTDSKDKRDQDQKIFSKAYLAKLDELLDELFVSYSEEETNLGACLHFKLEPGDVLDYGSQMTCSQGNPDEVKAMVQLAKTKGWQGIHLTGSDDFKERMFIHAVLSGAYQEDQIMGYRPSTRALEILELAGHTTKTEPVSTSTTAEQAPAPTTSKKQKI